ncbi:hypothetical protein QCN29_05050 [Streptomyces sp. HNM0663]|uniref:Uncharacterized protein n=1 Tax=Streptomyces chengmaiensis TaxID=3040919 RepID=A0ABT6HHC6_9ACTN|nr:hypothetical protein [Streptomyces chengmaiensis]MDH2388166.1 hypothetical protein [Streptomyces chengmaiensis]
MAFTISALGLFAVLLLMLLRFRALGLGAALVAVLCGFYLARSGAAGSVDQIMAAAKNALQSILN